MNRNFVLHITVLFILIIPFKGLCQKKTKTPPEANIFVKNFETSQLLNPVFITKKKIDTLLDGVHQFDEVNKTDQHVLNLGNNASLPIPLNYEIHRTTGFDFGLNQWFFYGYNEYNTPLWESKRPYTDINYTQGPNDLQNFSIVHSRNIKPNLNLTVKYRKISSDGDYFRQATSLRNLVINGWYQSLSNKYLVVGSLINNQYSTQENGGITDVNFFNSTGSTGAGVKYLYTNSKFQNREVKIDNYYFLGKKEELKNKSDSTDSLNYHIIKRKVYLKYTFQSQWLRHSMYDSFPDTKSFYLSYDSTKTNENVIADKINNQFGIGQNADSNYKISWNLSATYEFNRTRIQENNNDYDNIILGGQLSQYYGLPINISGSYVLNGFNQYDFDVLGNILVVNDSGASITLGAKIQRFKPSFIQNFFIGNHYRWSNDFNKSNYSDFNGQIKFKKLKLEISVFFRIANNLVLFNEIYKPQQYANTVSWGGIMLNNRLSLNKFRWQNSVLIQKTFGADDGLIRFPLVSYRTSSYFNFNIFKNACQLQIGSDLRVTSIFTPYSIAPEIGQLSVKNSGNVGAYPFVDAWISAGIKKFNIYFKTENILSLTSPANYYVMPKYPLYGFAILRIGLRWRFYN